MRNVGDVHRGVAFANSNAHQRDVVDSQPDLGSRCSPKYCRGTLKVQMPEAPNSPMSGISIYFRPQSNYYFMYNLELRLQDLPRKDHPATHILKKPKNFGVGTWLLACQDITADDVNILYNQLYGSLQNTAPSPSKKNNKTNKTHPVLPYKCEVRRRLGEKAVFFLVPTPQGMRNPKR